MVLYGARRAKVLKVVLRALPRKTINPPGVAVAALCVARDVGVLAFMVGNLAFGMK